jgi:hypothetical protein
VDRAGVDRVAGEMLLAFRYLAASDGTCIPPLVEHEHLRHTPDAFAKTLATLGVNANPHVMTPLLKPLALRTVEIRMLPLVV